MLYCTWNGTPAPVSIAADWVTALARVATLSVSTSFAKAAPVLTASVSRRRSAVRDIRPPEDRVAREVPFIGHFAGGGEHRERIEDRRGPNRFMWQGVIGEKTRFLAVDIVPPG